MRLRQFPLVLALLIAAFARPAAAEDVALTFDDLPTLSLTEDLTYTQATTAELLKGLRHHHWRAIGFVTAIKLEGPDKARRTALLADWLKAGMDLGNHGYSHMSLTKTPVDVYIADVARDDPPVRALLATRGRTPRWYRHPYLETGTTAEIRKTFEDWLAAHGYRVAPVTVENSDWMFALVYDDAILKGDKARAAQIKQTYVAYTTAVVPWYVKAASTLFDRHPSLVFLLHASRLNADSLDDLARILKANHLRPVTLGKAMADPAYETADTYVGPDGDEWISRWQLTLHKTLDWPHFPEPPANIAAEDERLDSNP
jgi:peptidoglycan/xylan/chitin deacetylase (PgdA/CDA1 family)